MKYIAYYRVSTTKQGVSGLGLEAQQSIVQGFTKGNIIREFTEVESGKNNARPQLLIAIDQAKKEKATLIVAKLDRLSRSLTFISSIMDAGIKFICADMPEANEFTLHIFAALAQQERKMISERTKQALSALKAKGVKLGKPENFTHATRIKGAEANRNRAINNEKNIHAYSIASEKRLNGDSLASIANHLNVNKFKTPNNCQFTPMGIKRLLDRKY